MDHSQLVTSMKRFLAVLTPLLAEWSAQFQLFQEGLTLCQPEMIEKSLLTLQDYQQKFNNLIKVRDQILKHASETGISSKSLRDLAKNFSSEITSELTEVIQESESHLRMLHQQLWSMWVISNRSQHSLSQMLDMFTQDSGQKDVYSHKQSHANHGGLLLDTAI